MREGDLLTTREIGTTGGTRQMDPGICFHPEYVISHTQKSWVTNMVNCRTKNATSADEKVISAVQKGCLRW